MFCTNCGSKVNDDAVFCINCGFKLYRQEQEVSPIASQNSQISSTSAEIKNVAPIMEQPVKSVEEEVVPVNIMVQPVPDTMGVNEIPKQTEGIGDGQSPRFMSYENQQYVQMQQAETVVFEKKNIIAFSILSVIFSLLTIAASVFEMIDDVSKVQDIARIIEIYITAIILIIYAFANNRTVSVLKGIAVTIAMVADIIFVGFSSIKYSIESLTSDSIIKGLSLVSNKDEWIIYAYFISMLTWLGAMYIFFIIDAIRGFIGTRRIKTFTLFFGFVAVAGIVSNIIFKAVIENRVALYSDIVPVNLSYVFLVLAMCFGITGKKKLKKNKIQA